MYASRARSTRGSTLRSALVLALAVAGLTAFTAGSAAGAHSKATLTKINYLLDFTPNGTDAGFYVARAKGFYEQAGFDVTITPGQGSSFTAQAVAAGNADFGTVASTALVSAVSVGAPVKMVGMFYEKDGSGIVVSPEIKTPKDLVGKTVAGANGLLIPLFSAYLKNAGIAQDQVKVVTVASTALNTTFTSGAADGCLCFSYSDNLRIRAAGTKTNFLPFADEGLTVLGQGIVVNTKMISENPDLVRKFVAASLKGWNYAYDNPRYAAGVMQAAVDNQSAYTTALTNVLTLKAMKKLRFTTASEGHPFGWSSVKDWATTVKAMKDGGALSAAAPSAAQLFTNAFLPAPAKKPEKS